jgi:putative redox protein
VIKLALKKGLQFSVQDDHGHVMVVDTLKDFGGYDEGFHPIQLLLVSLAACMGMDMVGIVLKKGGKIETFEIEVEGKRAAKHPKRYEKITMTFKCEGDFRQADLLRAHELSRDKYCGVYATLQQTPQIEFIL